MTKQTMLTLAAKIFGSTTGYAHCDIPCGIYDPHGAQIAALTVIRMADFIAELKKNHSDGDHYHDAQHDLIRVIKVKEDHAEMCKREIRVIWGDYFKPEMLEQYPNVNGLVHSIMQVASKARQSADRKDGEKLLELINEFSEIFWKTKGKQTKRVRAPYKPESEIVQPILE